MRRGMLLLAGGVLLLTAAVAQADFTAYNDLVWNSAYAPTPNANATLYTIGEGSPGPSTGLLKDITTGASTGVTATLTQNASVRYQPDNTGGGTECNAGTDATNIFGTPANVGVQGVVYYSDTVGWYVDLAFTGLNPSKTYEFVTTANRNGGSGYNDRTTKFTLSDADAFANLSSAGVTIGDAGASATFCTGNNTAAGYIARWTGIQAGADGDFSVRAQAASSQNKAYAFSVFKLVETPEPTTLWLLGLGALALRRRG